MYRSAFLLLLLPALALPDDPLECLETDFVNAFLSGTGSHPVSYSTEVPEDFEIRDPHPDMTLVGSRNQSSTTTAMFRTGLGTGDAFAGLADTLAERGWEDITYDRWPSRRGLQPSDQRRSAEFCREGDDTRLTVIVSDDFGQTLVSVEQYERRTLHGCLALERDRQRTLMDRMPVLEPPDGATTSNLVHSGFGPGVSSGVDISASVRREELLEDLENQVEVQGWQRLTGWSSDRSSGSVWSRQTPELGVLIGTLHVYDAGGPPARVRFSLDAADPDRDIDHGLSYASSDACG